MTTITFIRNRNSIVSDEDMNSVTIHPNPELLAKNESMTFWHKPLVIKSFKLSSGAYHCLCPVLALKAYMRALKHLKVIELCKPRDLWSLVLGL